MTYHKFSDSERREREAHLERLLEEFTAGQEPLQKALTLIEVMRNAYSDELDNWVIWVEGDPPRYRIMREVPR